MQRQMQGLNEYMNLLESGRALPAQLRERSAPDLQASVGALIAHGMQAGMLATECAWQLAPRVSRQLEKAYPTTPPGGWARLASLAAGCGILRPRHEGFEPVMEVGQVTALDEAVLRRMLGEAFSCRLVPPASAAGLFIMLGVHPAWALWVSHDVHRRQMANLARATLGAAGMGVDALGAAPGWRDTTIFEPHVGACVQEAIFLAIAVLVATLRNLDSTQAYSVDAFARLVRAACQFAHSAARQRLKHAPPRGLAPFLNGDGDANDPRARDFAAIDLLDTVLLPAGIAQRFDDGSFRVFAHALQDVRVHTMGVDEQGEKLTWMLAGQVDCRVA